MRDAHDLAMPARTVGVKWSADHGADRPRDWLRPSLVEREKAGAKEKRVQLSSVRGPK